MDFVEFRIQTSYRMCSCVHDTQYLTANLSLAFPYHWVVKNCWFT